MDNLYARLENDRWITRLPKVGKLKDGQTVTNYHKLPEETLLAEGWMPLVDIKPEFDADTQYLMLDYIEEVEGEVRRWYTAVDIEMAEPQEPQPSIEERLAEHDALIADLAEIVLEVKANGS